MPLMHRAVRHEIASADTRQGVRQCKHCRRNCGLHDMAASRTDLSEVSVDDLLAEVQRRLDCQLKPEKRLILIGAIPPAAPPPVIAPVPDAASVLSQH